MYFWGINISSVSFITLLMSVGLSVDYCVHIGHAFTHSHGDTPDERLIEAVKMMGTSVMKGGFTTFLGTVVLSVAASDAFRIFFKMLFSTCASEEACASEEEWASEEACQSEEACANVHQLSPSFTYTRANRHCCSGRGARDRGVASDVGRVL